ncbi:hypothetical protein GPZ77_06355 [Streptomyces sp. QHH-9511]|uniref:DUF6215 domain-containing protein n=1 Tax=Streptomyces sp. QHH-9511 TaxID=2684468 RepID=UPI0013166CFC|nr:DUF6215 domain-containing protein [Streptomyces sp. QHH-9511]QGZ48060.1 hypothetical protein GPZ77_06355 [Streptomyces sp. QHH-9511]
MAHDIDALPRGAGAWGQAVAAVGLIAAIAGGLWVTEGISLSESEPRPATCPGGEPEKAAEAGKATEAGRAPQAGKAPRRVSGAQLCQALNRPDLAELLGTPGEMAKIASGSGGSLELAGGKEIATPSGQVEFETYTVTVTATDGRLPVAESVAFLGYGAEQRTVLGRPAVLYSDRTISISFRLDGTDATSGPGVPARVLGVARDAEDSGGSFEVTLWRSDGRVPDDAVLLRVAEKVLPTVPGWAAAG